MTLETELNEVVLTARERGFKPSDNLMVRAGLIYDLAEARLSSRAVEDDVSLLVKRAKETALAFRNAEDAGGHHLWGLFEGTIPDLEAAVEAYERSRPSTTAGSNEQ